MPRPGYRTALLGVRAADARTPSGLGVEAANHVCAVNGDGLRRQGLSESKRRACEWWVDGTEWCSNLARIRERAISKPTRSTRKSRERSALQVPERCQSRHFQPCPATGRGWVLRGNISGFHVRHGQIGVSMGKGHGTAQPSLRKCNGPMQATHATLRGRRSELHSSFCRPSLSLAQSQTGSLTPPSSRIGASVWLRAALSEPLSSVRASDELTGGWSFGTEHGA